MQFNKSKKILRKKKIKKKKKKLKKKNFLGLELNWKKMNIYKQLRRWEWQLLNISI